MLTSEQLTDLTAALEDVEWARNSGDGSVSTDLVDELTSAVHRFVGLVHRQHEDQGDRLHAGLGLPCDTCAGPCQIDQAKPAYPIFSTYGQRQEVLSRLPEVDNRPDPSGGAS